MKLSKHKRWNASRKTEVALALLKGESLEEVSREQIIEKKQQANKRKFNGKNKREGKEK